MKQLKILAKSPPEYGSKLFSETFPSDISLKNPLIEKIMSSLKEKGFLDEEEDEVWTRLCVDEVLVNAIKHGNKEDKNKKVDVALFTDKNLWAIRVEDEGNGFSDKDIPDVTSEEYWEAEHGRGILLMQSYMDEVWYYDKGNRVQLKKMKKTWLQKVINKVLVFFKLK